VGIPIPTSETGLLNTLVGNGFVPVIASIGVSRDGRLLNVNADTLAGHLAGRLGATRLTIAGTTAGVLAANGSTTPLLDAAGIERVVSDGTASAGMVAKLRACEQAIAAGVGDVLIVDGRDEAALEAALAGGVPAGATRIAGLTSAGLKTCATTERM
jgi:acetylglutamate kinase